MSTSSAVSLSLRSLRANIWRGLLSAGDQEIRDGLDFYPGAHGLCRLISSISSCMFQPSVSTRHIAGIYAALSPMNGWDTNVANILDILRYGFEAQVNTPEPNRIKALAILQGADPSSILKGRKVTAFYRGIADPSDTSPIPVDRHLINLALGTKITSNQDLRSLASNSDLYSRIERVYSDLGKREGLGNRLASIAWFVQRRIQSSQSPLYHPLSPVCCNIPMHSHGHKPRRWLCKSCGRSRTDSRPSKYNKSRPLREISDLLHDISLDENTPTWLDKRERPCIYLGKSQPYMNRAGFQYLSRFVVQYKTGGILRSDEHVHHSNGILKDCLSTNLEVWLSERHGRHHARMQLLYMLRDKTTGRFMSSSVPSYSEQLEDSNYYDDIPF